MPRLLVTHPVYICNIIYVKLIMSKKEQRRILESCHSEPTSGHFGIMKTSNNGREVLLARDVFRCEGFGTIML